MKKRILVLTIIITLLLVLTPNSVFAVNNKVFNQKRITERQKFKLVKPTKAEIRAVGSELEYYKQHALEEFDEMYINSNNGKYTKEIKELINDYYEQVTNEINDADDLDQILGGVINFFGMDIPVYTNSLFEKLYTFNTLLKFDVNMVNSKTDFDEFKDSMITAVNNGFDCYVSNKSLYNDYYFSKIQGDKVKNQSILDNATDWLTLSESIGKVRMNVANYDSLTDFSEDLYIDVYCDEDYDEEDDYYDDSEDEYFTEELGINAAPAIYIGQQLYTKDEINIIKEGFKIYLNNYVDRQLENSNYPIDDGIASLYDSATKEISKGVNVDEIVSIYESTIERLEKSTGIEYKDYNSAKYKRLVKKLEELRTQYTDSKVYSDNGISENEYIIDRVIEIIDTSNIYKAVEVPEDLIEKVEAKLKETLTYKEELKQLKDDYIAELKSYKNNKKYNQSKVVPIVNEGIKKINAAKTLEDVWNLYDDYYEKAEATIYKFKITTSKVGKGTITKSATVKYGRSYTVKIKPTVGYKISAIYVDGKKVKLTEKYTFKNITKKHTIKAVFK